MNTHLTLVIIIASTIGALLAFTLYAIYQRRRAAARHAEATPPEPGPSGMAALQALRLHDLDAVRGQGVVTALMDRARAPKPASTNPYADGQARLVWFAGYAKAQAEAQAHTKAQANTRQAAP